MPHILQQVKHAFPAPVSKQQVISLFIFQTGTHLSCPKWMQLGPELNDALENCVSSVFFSQLSSLNPNPSS